MSKTEWLHSAPMFATNSKADSPLFPFLAKLMRQEDLSPDEAEEFFRAMIDLHANPAQMSGCLVALTAKGETFEELAGMTRAVREKAVKIKSRHKNFIDICGTGSSPVKTFNVSTAAAFVTAGAGLAVAKHSNRGVSSNSGSADVLGKLGIKISIEPEMSQTLLNGTGLCFLFAPKFHPDLRRVGDIRRALGIRSCLNLLGVLSNPSGAPKQVVGVWHPSLFEPVAQALALLGAERAWVIHGADGLDEMSLAGETYVAEIFGSKIREFRITPEDFGLPCGNTEFLAANSPEESAKIIKEVLSSKRRDEARNLIVLNAAAALVVGGIAKEPIQAARLAEQSIDSGQAQNKLERLIQTTNRNKA